MFCPKCGISVGDAGYFCARCGKSIKYLRELQDEDAGSLLTGEDAVREIAASLLAGSQETAQPPAMYFCNNCGTQVYEADGFCYNCGRETQKEFYGAKIDGKKKSYLKVFLAVLFLSVLVGTYMLLTAPFHR